MAYNKQLYQNITHNRKLHILKIYFVIIMLFIIQINTLYNLSVLDNTKYIYMDLKWIYIAITNIK